MLKGFKEFIMRGNVVDMAVGIVIGAAFGTVVDVFVKGILMQLISAIGGTPNFNWVLTINGTDIEYGAFLTALISFVIVAAAIYFVVIVPMNAMAARRKTGEEEAEPTDDERMVALLEEIAAQGRR